MPGRLMVGHLSLEQRILGSNPSPAAFYELIFIFACAKIPGLCQLFPEGNSYLE